MSGDTKPHYSPPCSTTLGSTTQGLKARVSLSGLTTS